MSTTTSINIGIPQGSVLGPLFFNICINDIKNCTNKFDIVSYADDTTLISTIGILHRQIKTYLIILIQNWKTLING